MKIVEIDLRKDKVEIEYNSGNIRIKNSYRINKIVDMIVVLRIFQIRTGFKSKRSLRSWIKEWKAHNRLYKLGLFRSHTVDCDLEEHEKWWRLLAYQFIGW